MGICEVLSIIFIVLKLIGTIDWSWWLVLLPEIIAFAFYILLFGLNIATLIGINKEIKRFKKNFREW